MSLLCSVDSCTLPIRCKGLCERHYRRSMRNGSPDATRPMGRPRTPDAATYNAVHLRLKFDRGVARTYACLNCGNQAQAWSYDHTDPSELLDERGRPYSLDLGRYRPLCWPCHNPLDRSAKANREAG